MPWSGSRQTLVAHSACVLDERPEPPRQALAVAGVEQDRVERGAEDVVLALVERAVADPYGPCARVAGEVVARGLGQVAPTVDPVHDLQGAVLGRLDVGDELHVLVGFPVQVQPVQRLEREGAVADPGVAVVPVALAARGLGQRGRQGGHGRAGRHVREPLDRQRGALDRIAPVVIRNPRPSAARRARSESSRRAAPPPPRRSAARRAPRPTRARSRRGRRARARAAPRIRSPSMPSARSDLQAHGLPGSVRVGGMAAAVDHRPLRRACVP